MALKHVGRVVGNRRKVIVAYRVIPGDPDHCLVVQTENLDSGEHDALLREVESASGQESYEFAEAMARTYLPDGRNMLAAFHTTGKIRKVRTDEIEMVPNQNTSIVLKELNETIAQQKGVTVADLALQGPAGTVQPSDAEPAVDPVETYAETPKSDGVLTDDELAAQYRSQADALFKEAKALREQSEDSATTKIYTRRQSEMCIRGRKRCLDVK